MIERDQFGFRVYPEWLEWLKWLVTFLVTTIVMGSFVYIKVFNLGVWCE